MWNTEGAYVNTTQPLQKLLQKDAPFVCGKEDDSYNEIIAAQESADGALFPYNPDLDLYIPCSGRTTPRNWIIAIHDHQR